MKIMEMWHCAKSMEALSPFWKHLTAPQTAVLLMDSYIKKANKELTPLKLRYYFKKSTDDLIKYVDNTIFKDLFSSPPKRED